jgi:hypothetical protein
MADIPAIRETTETGDIRYVAFCDILGFSSEILNNFDETIKAYQDFGRSMADFPVEEVQATMYSDAILITGISLLRVLSAVQSLWFFALSRNLVIRGAITHGRYWEQRTGNSLLVASDALVRAVKLEKSVGVPAVVIADDVVIPDDYWKARFANGPFLTAILHFRDRNIVNPFNIMWFRSAAMRVQQLMEKHPSHRDKYLWFLALHKAVEENQPLIPPGIFSRFIRDGILYDKAKKAE